ncbi:hypothetical protein NL676_026408 [Syzygium grande]|nr:hypothetical protein NL676_026408 [Syzygium grande]
MGRWGAGLVAAPLGQDAELPSAHPSDWANSNSPEAPPLHSAVVRESEVERERGKEAILRSLGARAAEYLFVQRCIIKSIINHADATDDATGWTFETNRR